MYALKQQHHELDQSKKERCQDRNQELLKLGTHLSLDRGIDLDRQRVNIEANENPESKILPFIAGVRLQNLENDQK